MDERAWLPLNVDGLTRRFGNKHALNGVSFQVEPGQVFGLVGENGAGKTTLIKHALGALRPHAGSLRVFGIDPVLHPDRALAKIGYLSEDHDLPGWMRVHELMGYTAAFFPDWDWGYAEDLLKQFDLDRQAKVGKLSRGQRALAGLLCAMAHRPPLLLLDEPSSGLDAVVRRDILGAIIRTVADEGRTVVFSSHLLDEVERVADEIALIHRGDLVLNGRLDWVKAQHHRVTLRFEVEHPTAPAVSSAIHSEGEGREWTYTLNGDEDAVAAALESVNATVVERTRPTLEDIFIARAGRRPAENVS